ncbi:MULTISPECIES: hypothetical protein [unclassified Cellulophaga]|uniref:hypothetical protein n=2 Tax=Cellulophaga TaxID=104264 RepID=UPI00131DAC6E|nr:MULTISPECIES: hypothetical protein [unclassified Cellulophaga]QXP53218.1 hypothetical protein H0I24_04590 [Cellulophaga sp. HaHa_2_1]
MIRVIKIICLSFLLNSCYEAKKNTNNKVILKEDIKQTYFKNLKEFKSFIEKDKWIDLKDDFPCSEDSRSITIKDDFVYLHTAMEPIEFKVESIKQLNSKTLEIKIKEESNGGNGNFQVEILNLEEQLVKWTNCYGVTFEAKPHNIVCKDWSDLPLTKEKGYSKNIYEANDAKITVNNKWIGVYYYESQETGKEFIIDSRNDIIQLEVGDNQYGYIDQLKVVQVGDTLGLFHHKNISGRNYNENRAYDFLKLYKASNGKFYFEGELPYLPKGAIEFDKVK